MRCEPANSLIQKLGGLTKVAKIVDGTPNGVMRWRMPKEKGGTGGSVPHWHVPRLLESAASRGIELSHADFLELPPVSHGLASSVDDGDNAATGALGPVPNASSSAQAVAR